MRAYTASALLLSILCLQTWVRSCCGVSLHGTSLSLLSSKKNRSKKSASSRRKSSKLSAPNPAVEEEEVIAADDFADESGELVVEGESGTADGTDNSSGGEVVSNEEEEGKGKMAGLQIAFSVFSLLANHLVSKLNFKDKTILRICRLTLVVYLVVSQLLVMLLKTMIKAENDTSLVEEPSRDGGVSQLLNLAKDHVPGMDLLKGMLPESLNSGDNSGNKASK